jgi:hypothetical protein
MKIQTTTENIIISANKWNYANFFKSLIQHKGIYIIQQASPKKNIKYKKYKNQNKPN